MKSFSEGVIEDASLSLKFVLPKPNLVRFRDPKVSRRRGTVKNAGPCASRCPYSLPIPELIMENPAGYDGNR